MVDRAGRADLHRYYRIADGKIVEDWGVDVQWQSGVVWE